MEQQTDIHKDVEGDGMSGVHVRLDQHSPIHLVATFDGDEQLSSWKAAMQSDDEVLFAKGVVAGKSGEAPEGW